MAENVEKSKKPIYKKWWFWVIVIVIVFAFALSGDTSTETATKVSSTNDTSTNADNSSNNTQTEFKVGDIVKTSDVKITFVSSNLNYKKYNSYSAPKKGNKIIRVEFKFENISDRDIYLENFECYADDEKCEEYYYADDYKSPTLESLSANKKTGAILYYEVPENSKNISLEYEDNVWTDSKVTFIVK